MSELKYELWKHMTERKTVFLAQFIIIIWRFFLWKWMWLWCMTQSREAPQKNLTTFFVIGCQPDISIFCFDAKFQFEFQVYQ